MDAYVCRLMHYEVEEVPYIGMAEALGVGCADTHKADIRICGSESGAQIPKSRKVVELTDAVEEVESCSACYGYLLPALDMLKQEGLLEKLDAKICIGQGCRGQKPGAWHRQLHPGVCLPSGGVSANRRTDVQIFERIYPEKNGLKLKNTSAYCRIGIRRGVFASVKGFCRKEIPTGVSSRRT